MIEKLLSPEVQKFIKDHQDDDPFLLSLKARETDDFPTREAIEQIQSLQKAQSKLLRWVATEGIVWPPPISIEQSSSEATAKFKASLVHGKSIVDLTGGMGVDVSFFSDSFNQVHYVEPNEQLCQIAKHNFRVLEKINIQIHPSTAETFLAENQDSFDALYIDPSRRSENKKVFKVEDCSPNLLDILPESLKIAPKVLVKLSPLVDISLLLKTLSPNFIWVVALKNEVKEVLCLVERKMQRCRIETVMLHDNVDRTEFKFFLKQEKEAVSEFSLPQKYIYEPNAAILKAGAFKLIGKHFGLKKLHQHTHLYTSNELVDEFPGKVLTIIDQLKQDKKAINAAIPDGKINVITRNFPLSSSQLKNNFKLKDGGDNFLIGTTLFDGKRVLLVCTRSNQLPY
jgi:predicted O-methyltransferase YrrM